MITPGRVHFFAIFAGKRLYVEPPEMQVVDEGDPRETLLRLFSTREQAREYLRCIEPTNSGVFAVRRVTLDEVWEQLPTLAFDAARKSCSVLRVASAVIIEGGTATTLETLWCPTETIH